MDTGKATLIGLTLITLVISGPALVADMTVYKDPNCGCCGKWVKDMDNTKAALGVPTIGSTNPPTDCS